jgi:hypothetical protein
MLEMGVLPDVAAATSATMILFTSAAAAVVFLSFGGVPPGYAGLAFAVGLLSTAAGQVPAADRVRGWLPAEKCCIWLAHPCLGHWLLCLLRTGRRLPAKYGKDRQHLPFYLAFEACVCSTMSYKYMKLLCKMELQGATRKLVCFIARFSHDDLHLCCVR